jgi:hypothetical protein
MMILMIVMMGIIVVLFHQILLLLPLNVVSTTTTQSFVPTLPPHAYSPSGPSKDSSNSSLPSTLDMTDEDAGKMHEFFISGGV